MAAPALPRGARRGGCAVREGREPRAGTACRTRAGIARAAWRGCRGVAGGCRAARPKGRSAGRPGCRPARRAAPGWRGGACPDHAHVRLRIAPRRGCGRRGGRAEGQGRDHAARAAPGAGGPCGRGPDDVGGGHHAGAVGPGEPATGRHVRRKPDGSRTGWRECPRRGPGGSGHRPVAAMSLSWWAPMGRH